MRSRPCQRTMLGGISLPSANISTAGWSPSSRTLVEQLVFDLRGGASRSSRNAMCCDQGSPTMTRSPWRERRIEQVAARRRVHAHGVDAELRHEAEVFCDLLEWRELVAVGVGRKGAVGDALDEKAVVAGAQELPVDGHTRVLGARFLDGADGRVDLEGNAHWSWTSLPRRQTSILPPKWRRTTSAGARLEARSSGRAYLDRGAAALKLPVRRSSACPCRQPCRPPSRRRCASQRVDLLLSRDAAGSRDAA